MEKGIKGETAGNRDQEEDRRGIERRTAQEHQEEQEQFNFLILYVDK